MASLIDSKIILTISSPHVFRNKEIQTLYVLHNHVFFGTKKSKHKYVLHKLNIFLLVQETWSILRLHKLSRVHIFHEKVIQNNHLLSTWKFSVKTGRRSHDWKNMSKQDFVPTLICLRIHWLLSHQNLLIYCQSRTCIFQTTKFHSNSKSNNNP